MGKIAFIIAMEKEAEELITRLQLQPAHRPDDAPKMPFLFYQGTVHESLQVSVTVLGKDPRYGMDNIGTEVAAVAAYATLGFFKPDVLISAGTAGSFAKLGASIGKVYLSQSAFYFHDHRIPIAGWDRYGEGAYPSVDTRALTKRLGLENGDVSSGNSLDYTAEELAAIHKHGAMLKEMEAGGIAWVAYSAGVPLFAIKSVTNLIDTNPDSAAEFEKNFAIAVASLTKETLRVIEDLAASDLQSKLRTGRL